MQIGSTFSPVSSSPRAGFARPIVLFSDQDLQPAPPMESVQLIGSDAKAQGAVSNPPTAQPGCSGPSGRALSGSGFAAPLVSGALASLLASGSGSSSPSAALPALVAVAEGGVVTPSSGNQETPPEERLMTEFTRLMNARMSEPSPAADALPQLLFSDPALAGSGPSLSGRALRGSSDEPPQHLEGVTFHAYLPGETPAGKWVGVAADLFRTMHAGSADLSRDPG